MARSVLDILVRLKKEGNALKETSDELDDTKKKTKEAGEGFDKLGSILKTGGIIVGGVVAAFVALNKAMEFGRQGAIVTQTARSFERLTDSLGGAPNLLEQLKVAAGGTVTNMELMAGVTQLVAGAAGDLAPALMDASPQLMEIAKAASALNPHLGTTSHMYESIGLGIKRASPMILDNLGITLKLGEANEAYAKSLGKTVDELTASEKSMAILNATLEAGNTLIEQAGKGARSAVDPYDRLKTAMGNLGDTIKAKASGPLADIAETLMVMITPAREVEAAMSKLHPTLLMGAGSYDRYVDKMIEAGIATGAFSEAVAEGVELHYKYGQTWEQVNDTMGNVGPQLREADVRMRILTQAEWEARKATLELALAEQAELEAQEASIEARDLHEKALLNVSTAAFHAADDVSQLALQEWEAERAALAAAEAEGQFKAALDLLHTAIRGEVGASFQEFAATHAELQAAVAAGDMTLREMQTALDAETEAFQRNTNELIYNIAERQLLAALEAGLIEDINASGTAYDEMTVYLTQLAEQLGIVDEGTLLFTQKVLGMTQSFIDGESTLGDWTGSMGVLSGTMSDAAAAGWDLTSAINSIPTATWVTVTTEYITIGGHEFTGIGGFQHGGQFRVGGPAGPDRTPVFFMASRGETVTVTPEGFPAPAMGGTTHHDHYNLTINSQAQSENVIGNFAAMRALGRF